MNNKVIEDFEKGTIFAPIYLVLFERIDDVIDLVSIEELVVIRSGVNSSIAQFPTVPSGERYLIDSVINV